MGNCGSVAIAPGDVCESLPTVFVPEEPRADLPPPPDQWGECPPILRTQRAAAKEREKKEERADQGAVEKAIPASEADCLRILTWNVRMDGPLLEARIAGIVTAIRQTFPNVVCVQEVTPMIWEITQRSFRWYSYGLRPTFPIPENAQYSATLLTRLPIIRETRTPYPNTRQQRDFAEAEISDPRGENVVVSTSYLESPAICDRDDIRSGKLQHVLTWFCGAEPRVFAADMNWANQDGSMGDISPGPPVWLIYGNTATIRNLVAHITACLI